MEIEDVEIYKVLSERNNTFYIERINKVISNTKSLLSRIPSVFSNYTNHDIEHSFRVANYMFELLPLPIENYNDTELTIMLYSAILHDIGMAAQETENISDKSTQDSIRNTHHIRSEEFINTLFQKDYFMIDNDSNIDFQQQVASIACSHGEDFQWITNNLSEGLCLGNDSINPQFISCLLRLGDYLDFDSRRTPFILYNFLSLPEISKIEWAKHFTISNFQKINKENNSIYFTGNCEDPDIYRSTLDYFSLIEQELNNAKTLLKSKNPKYEISINPKIDNQIIHKTFDSADLQYKMDYLSISNLLMGEQLYNDKQCALRELIQNALDAVLVMQELAKQNKIDYTPQIKIIISDESVTIADNGIGMTFSEVNNYFLNLGHSFYTSSDFKKLSTTYKPISHYGIGFLSSFLLSNSIVVKTTSYKQPTECNILSLKKDSRFVIQKKEQLSFPAAGTHIILGKQSFFEVFESSNNIVQYISDTFKDCGVQIIISENGTEQRLVFTSNGSKNRINLSNYLENIECTCSDPFMISTKSKKLHSIFPIITPFEYIPEYIYDPEQISESIIDYNTFADFVKGSPSYNIKRFLDANNNLRFFNVYPLDYEESEHFSQAIEILDDKDAAFEYIQKRHDLNVLDPIRI
ncbi:ATP-binding protein, partial [Treponema sp.]|uniref:HD domain-containing protein n=1 Tax=Treponema sp. TaxID=166 RepID=UPI00298E2F19